jgi:Phytanoyl-CoA dioxygenase (PhyH)
MTATIQETKHFRNGHHVEQGRGDTVYRGLLEHLPPPTAIESPEAAAELMYSDGCVQFPDMLSRPEVAELRAWMDRLGGPDEQYDKKNWCFNKHLVMDLQHDPMWLKLIDRSPAYEVLSLILGKNFVVTQGSLWVTGKGRAMGMHADHQTISLPEEILRDERVRLPIFTATLHYYLDDQVAEIGPTLVLPGSHLAGHPPYDESTFHGDAPKMVSINAGGAVLFRHDLWHGAAMNTSERRRYLIQVHYGFSRYRTAGPPITQPEFWAQDVLDRITPRQRILAGDTPGAGY